MEVSATERLVESCLWNGYSCLKFRAPVNNFVGCWFDYLINPDDYAAAEAATWGFVILANGEGHIEDAVIVDYYEVPVLFSDIPSEKEKLPNTLNFVMMNPLDKVDGIVFGPLSEGGSDFNFGFTYPLSVYFSDIESLLQFLCDVLS